jgi:hypothetical protein
MSSLKDKIIDLRKSNKSYREIAKELNCSLSTISFHLSDKVKQKQYKRVNKNRNTRLTVTREKLKNFFSTKSCVDCGNTDFRTFEFDRITDKKKAVSQLIKMNYGWDTIMNEINKCEIRCANCHRIKTAHQFNWWSVQ